MPTEDQPAADATGNTEAATQDEALTPDAAEDAMYDEALKTILEAEDADRGGQAEDESQPGTPADESTDQEASSTDLSDDDVELLARWHLTPDMVEGWSAEKRDEFIANARKRETDTRQGFQQKGDEVSELRKRLEKLESSKSGQGDDEGDEGDETAGDDAELGELGKQFRSALNDLQETYGDEFATLGPPIEGIIKQANQTSQALQVATQQAQDQSRIIVDMVIDKGINDLASDYPSVSKDEPRKKVEDKLKELWTADNSPYRTGEGSFHVRVQKALKAAAQSVLGETTEAAAQAQLVGKTKQRLAGQPKDGPGRTSKKPPQTEDEMYDQAAAEIFGEN